MRIAILCQSYPPMVSGAALLAKRFATGLADRGHQVLVIAASDRREAYGAIEAGVLVERCPSLPNPLRAEQRFAGWPQRFVLAKLNGFAPDVLLLADPLQFALFGLLYARRRQVPAILIAQQLPWFLKAYLKGLPTLAAAVERAMWVYAGWLMRRYAAVVVPTKTIADIIEAETGIQAMAISNGIDASIYRPAADVAQSQRELREQFGIPAKAAVILYAGRLDVDKQVEAVVAASAEAVRQHGAHLLLVGDGTQKHRLMQQCADLHIREQCHFPGFIRERAALSRIFQGASLFANASEIETQGLSLLEAAACGLPIAAYRATCVPEIVQDGVNGWLVEPGDVAGLGKAITELAKDPEQARDMGIAGSMIAKRHAIERSVAAYEQLAQGVIAKWPNALAARSANGPGHARRSDAFD